MAALHARIVGGGRRPALSAASMGVGMVTRTLRVAPADVVFVKGVFEASEGLAGVFAEHGGDLSVVAPTTRARELDEVLRDLAAELPGAEGGP